MNDEEFNELCEMLFYRGNDDMKLAIGILLNLKIKNITNEQAYLILHGICLRLGNYSDKRNGTTFINSMARKDYRDKLMEYKNIFKYLRNKLKARYIIEIRPRLEKHKAEHIVYTYHGALGYYKLWQKDNNKWI